MADLTRFGGTKQDLRGLLDRQHDLRSEARADKRKVADRWPIPRHRRGERFVCGPIPCEWLRPALAFGGKAGNLTWAIWWLAGMEKSNPIRLTGRVLRDFHISPRSARRLLNDFEQAGLLNVDRKRGRAPVITLLEPKPPIDADG